MSLLDAYAKTVVDQGDIIKAQADEIEQLRAEKERLGRQVNLAKYGEPDFAWSFHQAAMADFRNEIERLRERDGFIAVLDKQIVEKDAEIERLREALKHIAKRGPDGELWNTYAEIWMIADAALQQKETE